MSKASYIIESDYSKHFKSESNALTKPTAGDVLFSIIGTIGEPYLYKDEDFFGISSSVSILRPNNSFSLHSSYLYYWIKNREFQKAVIGMKGGVAQGYLSLDMIRALPIRYPSLPSQEKIASILSAFDDLIENNRRRIQLLEQAARLLYREWFVHFRFPGHEHVTITDGVPEGWEMKQVKNVLVKVKRPRKIKKSEFLKEATIPCVDQSQDFIGGYTDDEEAVVDIGQPVIVFGDHTRILKFVDFPFACGADGTQLIVSNDGAMSQEFLYFALDAIDLSNYFYARHFKFLKDQYIPRPPTMLLSQFTDNAQPILEQIKSLRDHCHHLSKTRNLLLPRLINGEVAV